jgi:hypothetical protein
MTKIVNSIEIDPNSETFLKVRELDLQYGLLGKLFGDSDRSPSNIAGAVLLLSTIAAVIVVVYPGGSAALESWKVIAPVITGTMGFLFGRNR